MRLTTVQQIVSLKRPRHIEDWMLLELQEHGSVDVTPDGRWANVRGYKATGATQKVEDR